ncbi:MAG: tetratricopeptide repeat protein, partial [Pseudomonadota bacterium]
MRARLTVVPPADVVRYADTAGWPAALNTDHARHAAALARQFGATHVLVSELTRNAGALRMSYVLLDANGRIDDGTMVGARSTELVKGMVRGIGTRLTDRRRYGDQSLSITGDPFVDEAYARGMSLALAGRCAEALPHFDLVTDAVGDLTRVRLERAACAQVVGQWEDAQVAFEAVIASLEDGTPGNAVRAEALFGLAHVHHRTGRMDSADALYQRALAEARAANDGPMIGRILIGQAIMAKDQHDFELGRDLLARATLALRDAGLEQLPGQLYSTQANIAMNDGKLDQAEGYLDSALESYRAAGDRRREAMILNNYGYLRRVQGRLAEAEPLHLQSLA